MIFSARFFSSIAIVWTLLLGAQASAQTQTAARSQTPAIVAVRSFYTFHLAHNKDFTLRNIQQQRKRFLTPELYGLLVNEIKRQAVYSKAHPDEAPDYEGDPLTDSQEYPDSFRVGKADVTVDRLKALVGELESTSSEGQSRITFALISNGTALMETMVNENMMTIYHPDGNVILMTHYCSAGNQPRMRAQGLRGDSIVFQYVDAANLKGSADGHMRRLVIRFKDANHVTEEWTWKQDGKETTSAFQLERVK